MFVKYGCDTQVGGKWRWLLNNVSSGPCLLMQGAQPPCLWAHASCRLLLHPLPCLPVACSGHAALRPLRHQAAVQPGTAARAGARAKGGPGRPAVARQLQPSRSRTPGAYAWPRGLASDKPWIAGRRGWALCCYQGPYKAGRDATFRGKIIYRPCPETGLPAQQLGWPARAPVSEEAQRCADGHVWGGHGPAAIGCVQPGQAAT
jgi:hypothetical protein